MDAEKNRPRSERSGFGDEARADENSPTLRKSAGIKFPTGTPAAPEPKTP